MTTKASGETTTIDLLNNYIDRVVMVYGEIRLSQVALLVHHLTQVKAAGGTVFVVGNGGSQANAQHLVLHLRDRGIRAVDLMADGAWLTAQSNDYGYKSSAARLLALFQREGDLLIVVSGSGNSENVLACLLAAMGYKAGLLGFNGGKAQELCDLSIIVPIQEYGPVEDTHSLVIHAIQEGLK